MIHQLELRHIGPADPLKAVFGKRLNVVTGDNGLGKSFLLDVCFWALTGSWPGARTAIPDSVRGQDVPQIIYHVEGKAELPTEPKTATFNYHTQSWKRPPGRPTMPGLVVYAAAL